MSIKHVCILVVFLCVVGGGATLVKVFILEFPLTPKETVETWRIEARIEFEGQDKPARVSLQLPQNSPGLTVISENYVTSGYGLQTHSPDVNRQAIFTKRLVEGRQVLYYRAVVRRSRTREIPAPETEPLMQRSGYRGAELAAASKIVDQIDAASSDDRAFQALLWSQLLNTKPGREEEFLLGLFPTRAKIARLAVRLMWHAGIQARTVHGLTLVPDRRNARIIHWTEIFEDGKWIPFDPDTRVNRVPADTLSWWRGAAPFAHVIGANKLRTDITVTRTIVFSLAAALSQQRAFKTRLIDFSVFGLPIQTQEVFRVLFVLPVGILVLVLLCNVIGVKTIGTFMPVLIALGFRDTGLAWGIILFVIIVAAGFAVRSYMEQLKLLMVPRLATVATVVIIIMAFFSVISFQLGINRGLSVSLFPIIILTMAIERMNTVLEEQGAKEAFIQMAGTLMAAILTFLVMNVEFVIHFMFVFPESLLVVLAAMVLLGRYSGYRLVELPRFKVLAGPPT